MARGGKLNARQVATAAPGRHGDGGGLILVVSKTGAKKWVFRFKREGRATEMGLGGADVVTLAEARQKAGEARRTRAEGRNPIQARREAQAAAKPKPTFGEVADDFVAAKESEWRNGKHRDQWRMTLTEYAAPLRSKAVDEVDTPDILAVLKPLWESAPETASRLRGRIEAVIDAARAKGLVPQNVANPARWRGHLAHLLPKRNKLARGNHAALPYAKVPAFMAALRERTAIAALALEFAILTAGRSGEALGATWGEFDMEARVWTIPAARMKAARPHRVPLSKRAAQILESMAAVRTSDYVFPGQKAGKPLSNMALEMVLRRMGREDITVHGFRSAFRDWAGDETQFPREVAEAALAHIVGDEAERAYRRGDALKKRRELMEAWAAHCQPNPPDA